MRNLAVLTAVLLAAGPQAQALTFSCTLDPGAAGLYIAPQIDVRIGEEGAVFVSDAIIAATDRPRVKAEIEADDASRLTLFWEVRGVKVDPTLNRQDVSVLATRLTLRKASGAAVVTVTDAQNWTKGARAEGTCTTGD